jgi:hypothetical protein
LRVAPGYDKIALQKENTMRLSVFRHSGTSIKPKLSFAIGLLVALFGLAAVATTTLSKVSAADCDGNAIIHCGFTSASGFISTVRANDSGNGHHDLQAVYAAYGLEPASYDKFVSSARPGTSFKDGRIVVDGQVVATNARSIGRQAAVQGTGFFSQTIAGTTYFGNTNDKAFASPSIPVMVLFDAKGTMQFAVLMSCGNPTTGTKVVSSATCNSLQKTPVAGKPNTYSFTTSATQTGNATITKYAYDFGDGSPVQTATSGTTPVTHTYLHGGTFTAKVTLSVKLPGNQQVTVVSGGCQTTITVLTPFFQCVTLTGAILDKSKFSFSFTANAISRNGASLVSADFTFGDGKSAMGVLPATPTTITTTHTYAAPGNFDVVALLHFNSNGTPVTAPACKALVTPTAPPTPECKPGVPVGDTRCNPCPTNPSVSASDTVNCVVAPPPELPNTGAGNVIAIFSAVVVGGFLVYRQLLFRKHKAAFLAAEQGTSPLPLGQPLDPTAPLAGTPLASRTRKGLRRPRQF